MNNSYESLFKTKGNLFVNSHYAIDPNNQNGIAFTVIEKSYLSRTGDDAYRSADGDHPILHNFQEILKAIKYRQNNFGSINTKNKAKNQIPFNRTITTI